MNLFTESKDKISWSRLTGTLIVMSQLIGYFIALFKTNTVIDIPSNWMILITLLYGLNKVTTAYQNKTKDVTNTTIKLDESA